MPGTGLRALFKNPQLFAAAGATQKSPVGVTILLAATRSDSTMIIGLLGAVLFIQRTREN